MSEKYHARIMAGEDKSDFPDTIATRIMSLTTTKMTYQKHHLYTEG